MPCGMPGKPPKYRNNSANVCNFNDPDLHLDEDHTHRRHNGPWPALRPRSGRSCPGRSCGRGCGVSAGLGCALCHPRHAWTAGARNLRRRGDLPVFHVAGMVHGQSSARPPAGPLLPHGPAFWSGCCPSRPCGTGHPTDRRKAKLATNGNASSACRARFCPRPQGGRGRRAFCSPLASFTARLHTLAGLCGTAPPG